VRCQVVMTLTAVLAPLTPLTSEYIYLNLRSLLPPGRLRPFTPLPSTFVCIPLPSTFVQVGDVVCRLDRRQRLFVSLSTDDKDDKSVSSRDHQNRIWR